MVEFPEKINLGEILSLYEGRKTGATKQPDVEKLNFDRKAVQARMNEMTHRILGS